MHHEQSLIAQSPMHAIFTVSRVSHLTSHRSKPDSVSQAFNFQPDADEEERGGSKVKRSAK